MVGQRGLRRTLIAKNSLPLRTYVEQDRNNNDDFCTTETGMFRLEPGTNREYR